ncbi:hypothetical protein BAR153v2_000740 [Bartonella sp. AR 15-3]|nr:hypothetical protein BAR153v2_000740 [Bartonella sp. AR 15-3]
MLEITCVVLSMNRQFVRYWQYNVSELCAEESG